MGQQECAEQIRKISEIDSSSDKNNFWNKGLAGSQTTRSKISTLMNRDLQCTPMTLKDFK